MAEHPLVDEDTAGPDGIGVDRSDVPRSTSLSVIETSAEAAQRDELEILGVALGITLQGVSLLRRALAARVPRLIAEGRAVRPVTLAAVVTGVLGGLVVGAARANSAFARRLPAPLPSVARPLSPLARPLEPALRELLTALEAHWRETCMGAEASAVAFARALEREVVRAALGPLDLTNIVRARVDMNALVDEIDVDRIVARVDIESLVGRVDIAGLIQEVLDEIDLPSLIRESTGTITSDAIEEARYVSLDADRMVARVIDRLLRRSRRNLDAPGEPLAIQRGGPESGMG